MTSTASPRTPASSSTSRNSTPFHSATPMPPSVHAVPGAGVPCWVAKYERPLPAHSTATVAVTRSSRSRSFNDNLIPAPRLGCPRRPVPNSSSRHVAGFTIGVRVWLRTKKRS